MSSGKVQFYSRARGVGLMQGLEFSIPVGEIIKEVQKQGLILISAGRNVVRFLPPLIIEEQQVDEMIAILKQGLDKMLE